MTLKFSDELIINGTEWTYTPFKFDVDSITPIEGGEPQPTSSNKTRFWLRRPTANDNTTEGDAEGFILGQNSFTSKLYRNSNIIYICTDNWQDAKTIEFTFEGETPTTIATTTISDLPYTISDNKCVIDVSALTNTHDDVLWIENTAGTTTYDNFKVLDSKGNNIASNFTQQDLYLPDGTIGEGFVCFDMSGQLNTIKQGKAQYEGNNYYYKENEQIANAQSLRLHTKWTLDSALNLSSSQQARFIALTNSENSSYLYVRTDNGNADNLIFGYSSLVTTTNIPMLTDFNSRVGHSFDCEISYNNNELKCNIKDINTNEIFTHNVEVELDISSVTRFALMNTFSATSGAIILDLLNTSFELDGKIAWTPYKKATKSLKNSEGLLTGSYISNLTSNNSIQNGILDLSNSASANYVKSAFCTGLKHKMFNGATKNIWGNNNSYCIRFRLPSSMQTAYSSKRLYSLSGRATSVRMEVSNSTQSTSYPDRTNSAGFNLYGYGSDNNKSATLQNKEFKYDTDYDLIIKNNDTYLSISIFEVKTGKTVITSNTSINYTTYKTANDVFASFVLGVTSGTNLVPYLVDLNHTYSTYQGHIDWTPSLLAIK